MWNKRNNYAHQQFKFFNLGTKVNRAIAYLFAYFDFAIYMKLLSRCFWALWNAFICSFQTISTSKTVKISFEKLNCYKKTTWRAIIARMLQHNGSLCAVRTSYIQLSLEISKSHFSFKYANFWRINKLSNLLLTTATSLFIWYSDWWTWNRQLKMIQMLCPEWMQLMKLTSQFNVDELVKKL